MIITNKSIYIYNRDRRVYRKGNKFYYIYKNNYKLVPSKMIPIFRGGEGDDVGNGVGNGVGNDVGKAEAKAFYNKFMKDKDDNIKLKKLVKHYSEAFAHLKMRLSEIINYINNGIKFLNVNRDKIIKIIQGCKNEDLSRAEAMVMISTIKKILFSNIFSNYFLEIIANNESQLGDGGDIKVIIEALSITSDGSNGSNSSLNKKKEEIIKTIEGFKDGKTPDSNYYEYFSKMKQEIDDKNDDEEEDGEAKEAKEADKKVINDAFNALRVKKIVDSELNNELEDSKKKFVELFQKEFFELRKTKYLWGKLKSTITKEFEAANQEDDIASSSYKIVIKDFLKDMLKNSITKERKDITTLGEEQNDYSEYLKKIIEGLSDNTTTQDDSNDSNDSNDKGHYKEIIDIIGISSSNTEATTVSDDNASETITKTAMIKLTNNMIILLKLQIYELYNKYKDIIDVYKFEEDIKKYSTEFKLTFTENAPKATS